MKTFAVLLATLLLAGCAGPAKQQAAGPHASPQADTEKRFTDAIVAPLTDLNLVRAPIPPVLAAARKAPYATPVDLSCAALGKEVDALNEVLPADLDTVTATDAQSLVDRGADAATDAVIGALRSTTEGVIPFRGWVRKITGAESHAREVAASIAAGSIRRAFLKGLGRLAGCPAPAAPAVDEAPLTADAVTRPDGSCRLVVERSKPPAAKGE